MLSKKVVLDKKLVEEYFDITLTKATKDYWHLHINLKKSFLQDNYSSLLAEFRKVFEVAHQDARDHFHAMTGLNLHPFKAKLKQPSYPHSMPLKTKKGFFGEIFCSIISTYYDVIEDRTWSIPVFLFRNHDAAKLYLTKLHQEYDDIEKDIPGRLGDDFLAIEFDNKLNVQAFLVGEAKYRKKYAKNVSDKSHKDLSSEKIVPKSLSQIIEGLRISRPENWEIMEQNILKIINRETKNNEKRVDVLTYIFDDPNSKTYPPCRISESKKHNAYTAKRSLQVVEVCFPGCEDFIKNLYDSLYT